jgi:two-component system response regulator YesN
VLAILQREISREHHYGTLARSLGTEGLAGQGIARSQDYIRTNLQSHLTMESVARVWHMSRSEFARRFRAETGHAFTEYLTEQRMQLAKTLLLTETDWPVQTVARAVGITSAHLRDIFVRQVQMSPSQFRQRCRPVDLNGPAPSP